MTLHATLYSKPGCHLCEDTLADLNRLRRRHPHHLQVVDVTRDSELLLNYGQRIPVLAIGGHEYDAPLLPAILEHALRQASAEART
jgi:hypothetical protein